ncbi:MAG: hypothetical protein KJ939_07150 [Nanoarchaeota archaeon]|nr:hypothetical protein [Nanoarchaeota archaeon]
MALEKKITHGLLKARRRGRDSIVCDSTHRQVGLERRGLPMILKLAANTPSSGLKSLGAADSIIVIVYLLLSLVPWG